jgi:methylenetetrahydrofolate reductase (NADPH)
MSLWPFGGKQELTLSPEQRFALEGVVANAKYEVIPLKNVREQAAAIPQRSQVTVTASPAHTLEDTLTVAEFVKGLGHEVTPHFSARMTRDRSHLTDLLQRAKAIGLTRVFVVGGDAKQPGDYPDGLALLRGMSEIGHAFDDVGVPSYPEGHADITDDVLIKSLKDKQQYANQTSTQMCFNPERVELWINMIRGEGITLPIYLGVPGALELTKLMTIAGRIGVGESAKFLAKNIGLLGAIASPGSFGADAYLKGLAHTIARPDARVIGLHIFTMNQVPATAAWHQQFRQHLRG